MSTTQENKKQITTTELIDMFVNNLDKIPAEKINDKTFNLGVMWALNVMVTLHDFGVPQTFHVECGEAAWIVDLKQNCGWSIREISIMTGRSTQTVFGILKAAGLAGVDKPAILEP